MTQRPFRKSKTRASLTTRSSSLSAAIRTQFHHLIDVVNGYNWELYNIADDYSENDDLAAKMLDKLRNMQELFLVEAQKYNVLCRSCSLAATECDRWSNRFHSGESSGLPYSDAPDIIGRSYSITAEVDIPLGGAEGMIIRSVVGFVAMVSNCLKASQSLCTILFNSERFRWEGPTALTPGKHTVVFDFKYEGPGFGKGGTGVQSVDGTEVARKTILAHHSVCRDNRRDLRRRGGYPHGRGRRRLPATLPVHRQGR